jgi:DNA-binding transcriptional regulator YiaG
MRDHNLKTGAFRAVLRYIAELMNPKQIANLRNRVGWTQIEMAKALGLASSLTVSHWETGTSTPTSVILRFLCLLDSLPDSELRKMTKRLEEIGRGEMKQYKP